MLGLNGPNDNMECGRIQNLVMVTDYSLPLYMPLICLRRAPLTIFDFYTNQQEPVLVLWITLISAHHLSNQYHSTFIQLHQPQQVVRNSLSVALTC